VISVGGVTCSSTTANARKTQQITDRALRSDDSI
jgi:hypothetical protein